MTLSKTNPEQIFFTVDAGFVGSHFILDWLDTSDEGIINFAADSRVDRGIRGTYHFPEKLTPLVIHNAKITVEIEIGGGMNSRIGIILAGVSRTRRYPLPWWSAINCCRSTTSQ